MKLGGDKKKSSNIILLVNRSCFISIALRLVVDFSTDPKINNLLVGCKYETINIDTLICSFHGTFWVSEENIKSLHKRKHADNQSARVMMCIDAFFMRIFFFFDSFMFSSLTL